MFFQRSISLLITIHYHFLDGGVGFGGGPDGSSSSHVISFPTFFQTSMSLPFTGGGGGFFSWGVPMALHYYMSYSFPMFFQRSMSLPFKGGGWFLFWGGSRWLFIITCHIRSPCSFKGPCHYHLRVGGGFFSGGGPDGSSSLHVIFFPMFFQRSMSLPFKGGGCFFFGGSRW